ncbi:MAG: hypothetical protein LBI81_03425 [Puniceicoccales bacterium]|jgi:DNA repair exonuclease SbcCD ATPase subunit|nr:hypothetical protein [Puniceicoccales bacterium]
MSHTVIEENSAIEKLTSSTFSNGAEFNTHSLTVSQNSPIFSPASSVLKSNLSTKATQASQQLESENKNLGVTQERINKLFEKCKTLTQQLKAANGSKAELEEVKKKSEEDLDKLKTKLGEKEKEIGKLAEKNKSLWGKIKGVFGVFKWTQPESEDAEEYFDKLKDEIEDLRKERDNAQEEIEKKRKEIEDLQEKQQEILKKANEKLPALIGDFVEMGVEDAATLPKNITPIADVSTFFEKLEKVTEQAKGIHAKLNEELKKNAEKLEEKEREIDEKNLDLLKMTRKENVNSNNKVMAALSNSNSSLEKQRDRALGVVSRKDEIIDKQSQTIERMGRLNLLDEINSKNAVNSSPVEASKTVGLIEKMGGNDLAWWNTFGNNCYKILNMFYAKDFIEKFRPTGIPHIEFTTDSKYQMAHKIPSKGSTDPILLRNIRMTLGMVRKNPLLGALLIDGCGGETTREIEGFLGHRKS